MDTVLRLVAYFTVLGIIVLIIYFSKNMFTLLKLIGWLLVAGALFILFVCWPPIIIFYLLIGGGIAITYASYR